MDIKDFFELVKNPEAFEAKLKEFESARLAADEAVKLVGPAKEIKSMHEAAELALAKAKVEADSIVKEAEARAAQLKAEGQASKEAGDGFRYESVQLLDQAKKDSKEAAAALKDAKAQQAAAVADANAAAAARIDVEAAKQVLNEKLEKLRNL
jgi:hypothetical protein